jgi:hypothetical protein
LFKNRKIMLKNFIKINTVVAVILLLIVALNSCSKWEPLPENPYDSITYDFPNKGSNKYIPGTFLGVYANVLHPKCAVPGCHDGHFEPDFRTIESSYNTLVYHKIIKNNADSTFKYRVVPGNKTMSVLYERITNCCFVNQNDRMPQDNIGVPLPQEDIDNIGNWINSGAKNMFGQTPTEPNDRPNVVGYIALNATFQRIDTNRVGGVFYNPFIAPQNQTFYLWVLVTDDKTPIANLSNTRIKISTHPDNFSSAVTINGSYLNFSGNEIWQFPVNTSMFPTSTTLYIRFYTNDGDHVTDTEMPTNNLIIEYKTYWSFTIN